MTRAHLKLTVLDRLGEAWRTLAGRFWQWRWERELDAAWKESHPAESADHEARKSWTVRDPGKDWR